MEQDKTRAVFLEVQRERAYQDMKWGADRQHTLAEWLLIAQREMDEARDALWESPEDRETRAELLQAAAVIFAALEQMGVFPGHTQVCDVCDEIVPWDHMSAFDEHPMCSECANELMREIAIDEARRRQYSRLLQDEADALL